MVQIKAIDHTGRQVTLRVSVESINRQESISAYDDDDHLLIFEQGKFYCFEQAKVQEVYTPLDD